MARLGLSTGREASAARGLAVAAVAVAIALGTAGCGYIVPPPDDSTPTPSGAGIWTGIATKVAPGANGGLHIDLAIRNDTGDWSEMHAAEGKPARLTVGGSTTDCATVFVGTGGQHIGSGFTIAGYTAGSLAKPKTQMLYVECAGVTSATGGKLAIDYSFVTGPMNYYVPSTTRNKTMQVDLDQVNASVAYPFDKAPAGVEKADATITAINNCQLKITDVARTDTGLKITWKNSNPTDYQVYVHIEAPVVGKDGVIYGFYQLPHLVEAPITLAHQDASWSTEVTVPKDVTGLYIMAYVESHGEKTFYGHMIDITSK